MKQKRPEWLPEKCHINWYTSGCPAFTKEILDKTKVKLTGITPKHFQPAPKEIFQDFYVNPDNLKLVIINSVYPLCARRNELGFFPDYKDYSEPLKEIWKILQAEYDWLHAENYLYPDLSDWPDTLLLNTELTKITKGIQSQGIWEEFMHELFTWFAEYDKKLVFCFLDTEAYSYAGYLKKTHHEVFYLFQPKLMAEELDKIHGGMWYWGLPF